MMRDLLIWKWSRTLFLLLGVAVVWIVQTAIHRDFGFEYKNMPCSAVELVKGKNNRTQVALEVFCPKDGGQSAILVRTYSADAILNFVNHDRHWMYCNVHYNGRAECKTVRAFSGRGRN